MTKNIENTENIIKLDMQSFIDMCEKIELQESHIKGLKAENEILRDENETYFETCNDLIREIRNLRTELDDLKENMEIEIANRTANMTIWDLSEEAQAEAGHALAKSLLGGK